jgi:hypothetical protein
MVSVPADLDGPAAGQIFVDDLGVPDRSRWRLLRKAEQGFREYGVDAALDPFDPGNAFWLITKESKTWKTGSGKSTVSRPAAILSLRPGWNQIGCPYLFSVSWADVVKNGDVEQPVGYGSENDEAPGYQYRLSGMEPWKGYYVRNLESQTVTVEIPAKEAMAGASKAPANPLGRPFGEGEWAIRLVGECAGAADRENWIGRLSNAKDEWDSNDFSEAPPFGEYLSVRFPHPEWGKYPGEYAGDFRASGPDSAVWPLVVTTPLAGEVILRAAERTGHCDGLDLRLKDMDTGAVADPGGEGGFRFFANGKDDRRFELTAGRGLAPASPAAGRAPSDFVLESNFPNPFNPRTRIPFVLRDRARVKAAVIAANGSRIRILADREYGAGRHELAWDGRDAAGRACAAGVYALCVETGSRRAVRKMVLMK